MNEVNKRNKYKSKKKLRSKKAHCINNENKIMKFCDIF